MPSHNELFLPSLVENGHLLLKSVLTGDQCARWADELATLLQRDSGGAIAGKSKRLVGGRNLQSCWQSWTEAMSLKPIRTVLESQLGHSFGLVRILFFDKPPGQTWNLALHRDRTIAVQTHHADAAPYGKPTTKAGVCHVEANEALLRQMLTLRFHLDAMHHDNGPLVVVSGSHETGSHRTEEGISGSDPFASSEIHCNAGDVFVMKPLLLHGSLSSASDCLDHRRVVHLEFSPQDALAPPYQWHQYDRVV